MWFVVDSLTFFLGRCIAVLEVSFFRSRNEENGYDHLGKKNHNMQKNCLVKCCVSLNNFLKGQYIIQV